VAPASAIGVEYLAGAADSVTAAGGAATPTIAADVVALLRRCDLPTDDLAACESLAMITARARDGSLQGCIALAGRGDAVLLRSLVVAHAARGRQLGARLVAQAEQLAINRGHREIYLLTDTAADFFARFGYRAVARSEVASEIRATAQFAQLCPASAVVLRKLIDSSPCALLPCV